MTSNPEIFTHALDSPSIIKPALEILRPHLPTCLPVYRRIQAWKIVPGGVLLTNVPSFSNNDGGAEGDGPWIIAYVNRTVRPDTEIYWFASWETSTSTTPRGEARIQDDILLNLFLAMKELPIPESIHQEALENDDKKDHAGISRSDYSAHLLDSNIVLCGAIHEANILALQRLGIIKQVFDAGLIPNHTFVFDIDDKLPPARKALPDGLRWGELKFEHFAIVRSRTQIPRRDKTLALLPNLAIYEGERPVAWVFVGLDGSLTTLHVEEEWRGKGLAKAIATKSFTEKMSLLWEEGVPRLAHGYVVQGNQASVHLCKSIGGKHEWESFWVRVDLGLVKT